MIPSIVRKYHFISFFVSPVFEFDDISFSLSEQLILVQKCSSASVVQLNKDNFNQLTSKYFPELSFLNLKMFHSIFR